MFFAPLAWAIDPPAALAATIDGPARIALTWSAVAGADHYEIYRASSFGAFSQINTSVSNQYTDDSVAANAAYVYKVRAVDAVGVVSADCAPAVAATSSFSDDPLIPRLTTAKASHVAELRLGVDRIRALAGLGAGSYADAVARGQPIRAVHITDLRAALAPARTALGLPVISYANAVATGTLIRAVDVDELRDAVRRRATSPPEIFWNSIGGPSGVQALATSGASVFAGTTASGFHRSLDNGGSWTAGNTGLTNLNVASIAAGVDGTLFAGTRGSGVFRSTDSGASWTAVGAGQAPTNVTTLLVTPAGLFAADAVNCTGVFLSTDNGVSWTPKNSGLGLCVTALAVAPSGRLFAGGATSGVSRSSNSGTSWTGTGPGMTSASVHALAVDGAGNVFATTHSGGVFRSADGGDSWTAVNSGLTTSDVFALLSAGDLYAGGETNGSVARSTDGASWTAAGNGLPPTAAKINAFAATGRFRFVAVDGRIFRSPSGYRLYGLDFSPYEDGQSPDVHTPIPEAQLIERMLIVRPYTKWIRTFGMADGLEKAGRIAHGLGLKAALGAWIDGNLVENDRQIDNLIAAGLAGDADLLIVGSEALRVNSVSESQLIAYINRVKQAVPGIPVATADIYGKLLEHPAVVVAGDVVLANIYPFWESIPIEHAIEVLDGRYRQVVTAAGGKPVIISETGWPSGGTAAQTTSVPSPENASFYFQNFVSWARANRVDYFYFDAFDELWKQAEGTVGMHWGVWDKDGLLKSGMEPTLAGETMADNWSGGSIPGGPGTPQILFTSVPPYGSFADLHGQVWHVAPADYRVAVYIKVSGGWWTKPTFTSPLTTIFTDGTWITDITTGGSDQNATEIAAFLVESTYVPPQMSGGATLPAELFTKPNVEITRSP